MRATAADRAQSTTNAYLIAAAAWLVPGAGHLWQGRTQKGVVFVVTLPLMFAVGLWLEGTIFPFQRVEPLVFLAAVAELGNGVPYFLAKTLDVGAGRVVAPTWEYGNSFMIVAGLLNSLVALDAFDIALGRK
jgi:hypothetical protein